MRQFPILSYVATIAKSHKNIFWGEFYIYFILSRG